MKQAVKNHEHGNEPVYRRRMSATSPNLNDVKAAPILAIIDGLYKELGSDEKVGGEIGLAQQTVNKIRTKRVVSLEAAQAMAERYHCTIDDLHTKPKWMLDALRTNPADTWSRDVIENLMSDVKRHPALYNKMTVRGAVKLLNKLKVEAPAFAEEILRRK